MYNSIAEYINMLAGVSTRSLNRKEEGHLIKLAQDGNKEARNKVINANLGLVIKVVLRFPGIRRNKTIELLDLFQECNINLLEALKRFNLEKGYRFATYAVWWIRNGIYKTMSENYKIRIPRYVITIIGCYYREVGQMLKTDSALPSTKTIAGKIGIPVQKMRKLLKLFRETKTFSLDETISDIADKWNDKLNSYYLFDKKIPSSEEFAQARQLNKKVRSILSTLTPREEKVLRMRFGIGEKQDYMLQEVGNEFLISRERVRQIEANAIKKLREKFVIGTFREENFQLNEYI